MEKPKLLADSPVNRGRQLELDVIKGLAILFMLLVHSMQIFSFAEWEPNFANRLIVFLGSPPAAPVFMFALGVGVVYSRKNTPGRLARRGLSILLLGFVFAFFRDYLSMCALYLRTGDAAFLEAGVDYLFGVDILPFAGLAFLFFALAAKLRFESVHYAAASFACAALNLLLAGTTPSSPVLVRLAGLFWGTHESSWFPFLSWIPYPILGYLFGQLLLRCQDKKRLYQICLMVSLPALLACWLLFRHYGINFGWEVHEVASDYFHHNLLGSLFMSAFVLAWTSAFYFLTALMPESIVKALSRLSKNITEIYVIHWLILACTAVFIRPQLPLPLILLIFAILVVLSDWLAGRYLTLKARIFPAKPAGRAAA